MNPNVEVGGEYISNILIQQEEAMRDLYKAYAECIPGLADFWKQMAIEEAAHADVLKELTALFGKKGIRAQPGAFRIETVKTNIIFLQRQRAVAIQDGVAAIVAISIALSLEESVIGNRLLTVFEPDTDPMVNEFEALQAHTIDHCQRLKSLWGAERLRITSGEDAPARIRNVA